MSQSDSKPSKPERPVDSPLFWHASGRWAKKIRGKLHYFGRGSHDDALAIFNVQWPDLRDGRVPRGDDEANGLTVFQLCAKFLAAKLQQRNCGELAPRSYLEYGETCKRLIKVFGRGRLVSDLRPDDFAKLRVKMADKWGPVRLKAEIIRSRVPFNWAVKNAKIQKPVVYGESFKVPSQRVIRIHEAKQGEKTFEAEEICRLLKAAAQPVKTMILLACNAGYGNNDLSTLPLAALDLDEGWVKHARPKTGIARRAPLWPETVEALRDWLTIRPEPKNPNHAGLVFITNKLGSWRDDETNRALSHEMRKLLDHLGIGGNRSFYALRHTFQSIGDESGDFVAVKQLMGHTKRRDISDIYRKRVSDERLRKVTEHIRAWLKAGEKKLAAKEKPATIPFPKVAVS